MFDFGENFILLTTPYGIKNTVDTKIFPIQNYLNVNAAFYSLI